MGFFQTNERKFSVHPGGSRLPSRVIDSSSGQTLFTDSVSSFDGIPSGFETRAENQPEENRTNTARRIRVMKNKIFSHPITLLWCIFLPLIGAIIQGIK